MHFPSTCESRVTAFGESCQGYQCVAATEPLAHHWQTIAWVGLEPILPGAWYRVRGVRSSVTNNARVTPVVVVCLWRHHSHRSRGDETIWHCRSGQHNACKHYRELLARLMVLLRLLVFPRSRCRTASRVEDRGGIEFVWLLPVRLVVGQFRCRCTLFARTARATGLLHRVRIPFICLNPLAGICM